MMNIQIRDMRQGFFWANNALIDSFLPAIGAFGLAVYMLLCRYASNETGKCEPSIKLIAKKLSTSEPTVRKAIKALKDNALLKVEERAPSKRGAHNRSNLYQLLPVVVNQIDQGGKRALPGVVNQVDPNHTNLESNQIPDNSSEGVPSSELAENASTHLSAVPSLTPQQQDLLRRLQSGKLLARYENPQDVQRLVDLNLIERCGVDGLVIKGQAKPDECADDPKVQELQTAIQTAFLPGNNGNEPEKPVIPLPQTPPPLPEVPTFKPGDFVWWVPAEVQRNLCGTQPRIAAVVLNLSAKRVHILSDRDNTSVKAENLRPREKPAEPCEWETQALRTVWSDAKAAARAQGKAKAPREHDVLFKAVAEKVLGYPPENGHKYTRNQCSQINAIKACVMQTLALPEKKTPADYQRGADAIDGYQAWFPKAHPDLTAPTHDAKFATYFNEFWKSQPASKPQGDFSEPVWFERRFWKREAGVLYCKPQIGEWAQALPSEVEKWQTR